MKPAEGANPNRLLRQARLQHGWSQARLAQELGCDPKTVSRWECGRISPRSDLLTSLCEIFKTTPAGLGFASNDRAIPSLPEGTRQLIGREELLQHLRQLLVTQSGLMALTGLPGVGKTALGMALVQHKEVKSHFQAGILWAGLGPHPNLMEHLGRWGALLGLESNRSTSLTSPEDWSRALRNVIGQRRMLILLDDVWSYRDALALKVGGLDCVHLITTRFPLLAHQWADQGEVISVPELNEQESIRLLESYLTTAGGPVPEEMSALANYVAGLPLALKLIGNYLRIQGYSHQPGRLAAAMKRLHAIDARFQLEEVQGPADYSTSPSDRSAISLKATIDLSVQQLTDPVRRALFALSIFSAKPNTFSEEAALAVICSSAETLYDLTDNGLLEPCNGDRYTLHQTIADYARLHLAPHQEQEAKVHMAAFFACYLENGHYPDTFELETRNIIDALKIMHQREMGANFLQSVIAFVPFLEARGLHTEAALYLGQAQEVTRALGDDLALAQTWLHLGKLAELHGDMPLAEQRYQESLVIARKTEQPALLCQLLSLLGGVLETVDQHDRAQPLLHEGLALARKLGDQQKEAVILKNLGEAGDSLGDYAAAHAFYEAARVIAHQLADFELLSIVYQDMGSQAGRIYRRLDQAEEYFQQALRYAQQVGLRQRISAILMNLGMNAFFQEEYAKAEQCYQEALVLAEEVEHHFRKGQVLQNLGMLESVRGNFSQANQYFQQSIESARRSGLPWLISETLCEWGDLRLKERRYQEAIAIFQEALAIGEKISAKELDAAALFGLAQAMAEQGDPDEAQLLAQRSLDLYRQLGHAKEQLVARWLDQ
ncbi:MAG TPA: tetratricopeptide repeat protein [Ktedonosporobacter sp.]|nr:tetratricopeptide repeat protein [Ktedonosporobacter sp.]